jgi:hypothetical protein
LVRDAAVGRGDRQPVSESPNDSSESEKWSLFEAPGEAKNGAASGSSELTLNTKEA